MGWFLDVYVHEKREFKDVFLLQLLRPVWFLKPLEFSRPVNKIKTMEIRWWNKAFVDFAYKETKYGHKLWQIQSGNNKILHVYLQIQVSIGHICCIIWTKIRNSFFLDEIVFFEIKKQSYDLLKSIFIIGFFVRWTIRHLINQVLLCFFFS